MLKAKLDTLDGLDENLHQFYEEKDGTFNLKVEGFDDASELKLTLQKEREARKSAEKKATELESLQKKKTMQDALDSKDIESVKKQLMENFEQEKTTLTSDVEKYKSLYMKTAIDNQAVTAISNEGGIAKLLMPFVKSQTRLSDDGTVQVIDAEGQLRVNKDGSNMSVSDLVKTLKTDPEFSGAFKGSKHSGGGMPSDESAGGGQSTRSSQEKIKAGLQAMKS